MLSCRVDIRLQLGRVLGTLRGDRVLHLEREDILVFHEEEVVGPPVLVLEVLRGELQNSVP